MWWAGKELTRDKTLGDFVGKNEKTKIIAKLQKVECAYCTYVCNMHTRIHACTTLHFSTERSRGSRQGASILRRREEADDASCLPQARGTKSKKKTI